MPIPGLPYDVTQPALLRSRRGIAESLLPPGWQGSVVPQSDTLLPRGWDNGRLPPGDAAPAVPATPAPAPGLPPGADFRVPPAEGSNGYSANDEAQWGGAGTQKQTGDLPQPLKAPKPAGISAQEQQVLDAQDQKRQGALLGDINKFQGYQKANLAAAEGQASGQGGPPLPMLPALDTIGSGDTGGNFPDVANDYRGLELMRSLGMPVPSQQGSDAYAREKYAEKQKGFQDRRSKLLEESTGALSPLQQQDLRRRYNQVGLEESQAPDMPPALRINTQVGDQAGSYAMPSEARSRFVTPGTPEFEESQRAGTARSALAQALHDTPPWLHLEGERMKLQAQQAAEHKTTIERWWAAHPQGTAPQFESFLETLQASDTLRRERGGGSKQEPGLPGPGQAGAPMGPAEPGLPGSTSGAAALKAAREKAARVNTATPDAPKFEETKGKVSNYSDIEQLIEEMSNQPVVMANPEARAEVIKLLQEQGAKGIPNLNQALEHALAQHARSGNLLPTQGIQGPFGEPAWSDTTDINGIKLRWHHGAGYNKYEVDRPGGTANQFNLSSLFSGPLVAPITRSQVAAHVRKAQVTAELLKEYHRQQQSRGSP